jgi:glyoxylase-like metal-dependent hydrolase (beta-lactamase superfamily II)
LAPERSADERDLAALGIWRVEVPVPFPQTGGSANVYLLESPGGGLILFDAGLGTPAAEQALADGFRRAGKRFEDVERIVLSHGHIDHFGAARTVIERRGAEVPVHVHPLDAAKITLGDRYYQERRELYAAHYRRLGVPEEVIRGLARWADGGDSMARAVKRVQPIEQGQRIEARAGELVVHHMPGHTPGMVCLHAPDTGIFLSGDHLLERISPNPLLEPGPNGEEGYFQPLVRHLESLERLESLDVSLVLPGHGAPFGGHREVIDRLRQLVARRQERVVEVLRLGPTTAHGVAQALFPRATLDELIFTLSEAAAHLELLERDGRVSRQVEAGQYLFQLAAGCAA